MAKVRAQVLGGPHSGEMWLIDADLVRGLKKGSEKDLDMRLEQTTRMWDLAARQVPGTFVDIEIPHADGFDWLYRAVRNMRLLAGDGANYLLVYQGRDPFAGRDGD